MGDSRIRQLMPLFVRTTLTAKAIGAFPVTELTIAMKTLDQKALQDATLTTAVKFGPGFCVGILDDNDCWYWPIEEDLKKELGL